MSYRSQGQFGLTSSQVWSVPEAIEHMKQLVEFKPVFIEGMSMLSEHFVKSPLTLLYRANESR